MKKQRMYCPECSKYVLAECKDGTNHILHLLLTIITHGFWLIIWFFVAAMPKKHLCSNCGCETSYFGDE